MPNQYTFNDFDPREFEFLCRDLLQRRITEEIGQPFFFNSFSEGADGGIDAIFEDKNEKIVLQCKRYSDFNDLYSKLKYSELPKVIKLTPTRYIIATSCKLSKRQMDKVYALFKPYAQNINDILGQAMINNLLAIYPDIELNYPRLYFNNATVLNRLLQANVYNQSIDKLKKYQKISRFYVPDGSFQQALKILEVKRYVIISGEPGVGKSTLAGMLSLYYLEREYEFVFLRRSISEAEGSVWDEQKKQVFFFDDFLGSTSFEGFERNEDRQLLDFISKIADSSNKLLLITTREYIFKQAEAKYPELKRLEFTKCLIRQKEFKSAFKINILYNYLYYSNIELKHIEGLLYNDHYERIIYHSNFTPRLINDYIERYYNKYGDSYSLYLGLKKYLDDPHAYWEEIFLKLSENTQILLLIMAITEQPAIEELLFETFIKVGQHRKIYKMGYEKDSFMQAVAELSESFISLSHNPEVFKENRNISSLSLSLIRMSFGTSKYFEFQNPSIKDFAVNYLRKREDLINFLIRGVTLFNQLYFVFATSEDDKYIEDYDSDISFTVDKIILPPSLCNLVADKMIAEFDSLPIAKIRRIDWEGGNTSFHLNEDQLNNRMDKLWLLCHYFPLAKHETVLTFVKEKYEQLFQEDKMAKQISSPDSGYRSLSLDERITQIDIIKKLQPFVLFDQEETVQKYYDNIRFAKEYIFLHFLQEIFPDAYQKVVTANIKEIRRKIKETIYDDIDYYLSEGTHEADNAIAELIDEDINQLEEIYKFKLSKKLMQDINGMAGSEIFQIEKVKKKLGHLIDEQEENKEELPKDEELNEQKYKSYQLALKKLLPQWTENWEDQEGAFLFIWSRINDTVAANLLINRITNHQNYNDLLDNTRTIDLLIGYLHIFKEDTHSEYFLYEHMFLSSPISKVQLNGLQTIAYNLYINDLFTFRKETFENVPNGLNPIIITQYSAILEQQDIWFRFPSKKIHVFLTVRHIINCSEKERIDLYRSFIENEDSMNYATLESFWRLCYQADKNLFCTHFIIPVIQAELDILFKKRDEEMAIDYLEKNGFYYEFYFVKKQQRFELNHGSRGGNFLLEEINRSFEEWNIPNLFDEIENCFNLSEIKNISVSDYMQKHCPVTAGKYKINLVHELKNADFQKLLKPVGVTKIIIDYAIALKNLLLKLQEENIANPNEY